MRHLRAWWRELCLATSENYVMNSDTPTGHSIYCPAGLDLRRAELRASCVRTGKARRAGGRSGDEGLPMNASQPRRSVADYALSAYCTKRARCLSAENRGARCAPRYRSGEDARVAHVDRPVGVNDKIAVPDPRS